MLYGADDSRVKRSTRSCWAGGALGGPAVLIQHTAVRLPGRLACTAVPSAICLIDATRSTPAGNDAGRETDHQRRRSSRHSVTQPETATVCGTVCTRAEMLAHCRDMGDDNVAKYLVQWASQYQRKQLHIRHLVVIVIISIINVGFSRWSLMLPIIWFPYY